MVEDLADNMGILDARDDLDGAAAFTARLDVDVEDALESLCLGHGGALILAITHRSDLITH